MGKEPNPEHLVRFTDDDWLAFRGKFLDMFGPLVIADHRTVEERTTPIKQPM
jgi:hypothetical protein